MRPFNKTSPAVWVSPAFRSGSDDSRLLQMFYLTSPHQNVCGCFPIPDGYAITDMIWPLERYQRARDELINSKMIMFDSVTMEILVLKWFKHNPPMNPSHRKSVTSSIEQIRSDTLRAAAYGELSVSDTDVAAREAAKNTRSSKYLLTTPRIASVMR